MKLPKQLESLIDLGGLGVAMIVDLILNVVCFAVLAPDTLTRVAFVAVGIMTVLFIVRSWAKGQRAIWLVFVVVVFFFDLSFSLEATRLQDSVASAATDTELQRLTAQTEHTAARLDDLQSQYRTAMRRETLDQLHSQIEELETQAKAQEAARSARLFSLERGRVSRERLSAEAVFGAISRAWSEGRRVPLAVFGMIFLGLQLIVATSIDAPTKLRLLKPKPMKAIFVEGAAHEHHLASEVRADGSVITLCGRILKASIVAGPGEHLCQGCSNLFKSRGGTL